jgi:hypothetical protein
MRSIAEKARQSGDLFYIVGDISSPAGFELDGCRFLGIDQQMRMGSKFAEACPTRHYARKNIGYLAAIRAGAEMILETDDDNLPEESFFSVRQPEVDAHIVNRPGWINVYHLFSDQDCRIWPRGLPLDQIGKRSDWDFEGLPQRKVFCPIQQHLADSNPDVDAVYRLVGELPFRFVRERQVALAPGSWCPFNSQNTTWWPEAYSLLYLPSYCSFRMTDIWRSFVAARIAHANGWHILFASPTVRQERNEHDLMRDFADEIAGYLNNSRIRRILEDLPVESGQDKMGSNLRLCYEALVAADLVGANEVDLLSLFLDEAEIRQSGRHE